MDERFKSFVSRLNYKSASFCLFPGFFSLYPSLCIDILEFLPNTLCKQMLLILNCVLKMCYGNALFVLIFN